jgi:WS/DGAT/MGAT family acyltransferase
VNTFLRSSDAFVWSIGADPRMRSTIVSLMLLDRSPDFTTVVRRFRGLSHHVPMFRDRVVPSRWPLPPRWQPDPEFDLAFHVRRVGAPGAGDLDAVLELARLAAMADFDPTRPLWEATLIDEMAGGGAALLCRMNHALTDGVGAVEISRYLFDDPRQIGCRSEATVTVPAESGSPPVMGQLGEVVSASIGAAVRALHDSVRIMPGLLFHATRHPAGSVRSAGATAVSLWRAAGPQRRGSPSMCARGSVRAVFVHEVPTQALHRAAAVAGGSLNDAFLAAVTAGLRDYHADRGTVAEFTVTMPINQRNATDQPGGNRTTLMRFRIPAGPAGPAVRMRDIHRLAGAQRTEKSLAYTSVLAGAVSLAPRCYIRSQFENVDFIASNVPGPAAPVSLVGAAVQRQYAFSPTLGAAFNVTLLSYDEVCGIGVNVDTAAIPDVELFRGHLIAGFDEVIAPFR